MDKNTLARPFIKRYVVYNVIFVQHKEPLFLIDKKGCKFGLQFCLKREGRGRNW